MLTSKSRAGALALLMAAATLHTLPRAFALQPPRAGELDQYAKDGSLQRRLDRARSRGNHRLAPSLVRNVKRKLLTWTGQSDPAGAEIMVPGPPPDWQGGLPASGSPKTFVLLVDFSDYPHSGIHTQADVAGKFFDDGDPLLTPYESLRNYYQRASYGALTIQGTVFDWYRAQNSRSYYYNLGDGPGQEALIMEALDHFDAQGHDFSQYDNDADGVIDSMFVKWTGPDSGWSGFWWAYQWSWHMNTQYRIDGKALGKYVWSWIAKPETDPYMPRVDIHETGHLLGLPDLYDYDITRGPEGGVGGLDMMDSNWGDHNCFSKYMLGWLTPVEILSGSATIWLEPSGTSDDCVLIMRDIAPETLFGEFFMVQYRKRSTGNDPGDYPADGYVIWHVDSTLNWDGSTFLYDNSYTSHKYLRLMEADGQEQIEMGLPVDAGDLFIPNLSFSGSTTPNSHAYSGLPTGVRVDQLTSPNGTMAGRFTIVTGPEIQASSLSLSWESCTPTNVAIDPYEQVLVSIELKNTGIGPTTSLVATLLPVGGVINPSPPQNYGALAGGGGSAVRIFSFTASGSCSTAITPTLQLVDGGTPLDSVSFSEWLGVPSLAASEQFDGVAAPLLPAGWTTTSDSGPPNPWTTSTAYFDTAPNAAFKAAPDVVIDTCLNSPAYSISKSISWLIFRHRYNFENGYDGGVLEMAVDSGTFVDVLAAGAAFEQGGYNLPLSTGYQSPIGGRLAWTGGTTGFITTRVRLPASVAGHSVRFRWRLATDVSVGGGMWAVDGMELKDGLACCGDIPGDMDDDGDVDQADFGRFQACLSGNTYPQTNPACERARLDADSDVDGDDFILFRRCISGPGVAGDINCAD